MLARQTKTPARLAARIGLVAAGLLLGLVAATPRVLGDCGAIEPIDVLPADEACASWTRDGEPQTAHTEQELFELINGAAGLYIYYGFVAAAIQNYTGEVLGTSTPATLSIFNQGTSENAENLFLDEASGTGTLIEDWSGSGLARIQADFGMTVLDIQEECFFTRVLVLNDDDEGVAAAYCLGLAIVDLIQGAVPVDERSWGGLKTLYRQRSEP